LEFLDLVDDYLNMFMQVFQDVDIKMYM